MESAVRRFARNILLLHFVLLGAVLGGVFFASRAIEKEARRQALEQAQSRQRQIAIQTARGIEGFYRNLLSDMDLVPPNDDSTVERLVLSALLRKVSPALPLGPRGSLVGLVLARQLEERVSHLFVIDREEMVPHGLLREDLQEALRIGSKLPSPPRERGGRRPNTQLHPSGPTPTTAELDIVQRNRDWLRSVKASSIKSFGVYDSGGMTLIAMPLGPRSPTVMVAAVPIEKINEKFLAHLNDDRFTGAFLLDESLTAMAASRPNLVGASLADARDEQVKSLIDSVERDGATRTLLLRDPFHLGAEAFAPALVTAEPIEIVPGKRWFLLIASPLSEVDRVVADLFQRVVWWGALVTLTIAAILVSTAVTLIRGRVKLERMRMQTLRRELDRARQIQEAWLPHAPPACPTVEVCAVNLPAHHISGDFYNWFDLPDGRIAIVIGDVTGHGMSAAFLMATTQLLVRTILPRLADPGRCLTAVNRHLCTQGFTGQFVTMQALVLDPTTGAIDMASAGHPPPLIARPRDNDALALEPLQLEPEFILGVEPTESYRTIRFTLAPDALLLLYTDGAADVSSPAGRRFGADGIRNALSSAPKNPAPHDAASLLHAIVKAVHAFRGAEPLGDDLTLLSLRLRPPTQPPPPPNPAADAHPLDTAPHRATLPNPAPSTQAR